MAKDNLEREAVILGALLHDIGKFSQRAQKNPKEERHTFWGERWFTDNLAEKLKDVFGGELTQRISSMINCHHDSEEYISLADAISAGVDRIPLEDEEKGDPFTSRLISTFSRISISSKSKKDKYYKLAPLGKNNLEETFPVDEGKCQQDEYKDLLDSFNNELKLLNFVSPQQAIEQIYFLLWKYTWCIPSAVYKTEGDVPLFDHLKTTSAIAACLYDYHQENSKDTLSVESPAFQLIGGDISGIQSYIFDVLSQQGKVAKRLRARSLYVQLLSEVAAHKIIHQFNLPLCNILSSAGGNFYILLPNLKSTNERLKKIQEEFDTWTYKNLKGEIYISISRVTANGKDLGGYNKLLDDLKRELQIKKYKPYSSILTTDGKWNNNCILDEVVENDEKVCSSCHKHPAVNGHQGGEKLCERCFNDEEIGTVLPDTKFIAFFKESRHGYPILNYSFNLWKGFEKGKSAYLALTLNDTSQTGTGFKFLANHIPINEDIGCQITGHQHKTDEPVFFDCIADKSRGENMLGYVKADIDNMGKILLCGFLSCKDCPKKYRIKCSLDGKKHQTNIKPSISRFTSFSRLLETFFAGYLQRRLETDFKDIYTVFSGGDDLFVVGPWNRAIDFVRIMRGEFARFTGENSDFTFSAGVILAKPHQPISFCAEYAEEELKKSKDQKRYPEKDRVTLFDQTIKWNELDKVLSESQRVINWLEREPPIVSRGFIRNLRKYGEMKKEFDRSGNTKYLKFVPLLHYDIYRNLTKDEQEEARDWAIKLSPTFQKPKAEDNLPFLTIIMDYVLTYARRR